MCLSTVIVLCRPIQLTEEPMNRDQGQRLPRVSGMAKCGLSTSTCLTRISVR